MTRPTFGLVIAALRYLDPRWPWVGPTDEEGDIAAVLEYLQDAHQGTGAEPDLRGRWGRCTACGTPWPCDRWMDGESLAVQYLGRAADRVHAHAQTGVRP